METFDESTGKHEAARTQKVLGLLTIHTWRNRCSFVAIESLACLETDDIFATVMKAGREHRTEIPRSG